jgi:uncharacterized protein (TIGR01244 family)
MWPFSSNPDPALRFRKIDPDLAVAGQISTDEVQKVADAGFKTIVCARPDNEEPGQPRFAAIAAEARRIGLQAVHIPVAGGIGEGQLIHMEDALKTLPKPMLGYCRSGARAGYLFSAARSALG